MRFQFTIAGVNLCVQIAVIEAIAVAFLPPIFSFPLAVLMMLTVGFPVAFVGVTYQNAEAIPSVLRTVWLCGVQFGGFLLMGLTSVLGYFILKALSKMNEPTQLSVQFCWALLVTFVTLLLLRFMAMFA